MPIIVTCPTCGTRLKAPDNAAGRHVKCSKCANRLSVPMPGTQLEQMPVVPPPPPLVQQRVSAPTPPPLVPQPAAEMKECPYCAEQILVAARKCKYCGESLDDARHTDEDERWEDDRPRPRRRRPPRGDYDYRDEPRDHRLTPFPTALVIVLNFVTLGIFTSIWLNLMHGKMPRIRHDDPSAGKAIGFLFIPFYNLYWVFFTYQRLCLRINEQRRYVGLQGDVPTGLALAMCIVMIIPYVGLVGFVTLVPIFAGIVQSKVNELCEVTQRHGRRDSY